MSSVIMLVLSFFIGFLFLMLFLLVINTKKAKVIAEQKFKKLNTNDKQKIIDNDYENLFLAYLSKDKLSNVMVKNMCHQENEEEK